MRREKIIKRITFALFLLKKIKFEKITKITHIKSYIYIYIYIYIYDYIRVIFCIPPNLIFGKKNNTLEMSCSKAGIKMMTY